MRRAREEEASVPPTPVSGSVTHPAAGAPASPSALQVVVAALDRTLGSDARTERALRLLRPVLFTGVLAVMGVALILVAVTTTGTWGSLVCGMGLTVASAGTAIVRHAIVRRQRRRDPSPSVVARTPGEATTTRHGRCRKSLPRKKLPSNQAGAGASCLGPRCAVGKNCAIVAPSGAATTAPVASPTLNRGSRRKEQDRQ
jgi:hypothetical protein